jgi:DNA anti-recombination protein RmuC
LLALVFLFGAYLSWQQQKIAAKTLERHSQEEARREEAYVKRLDSIIERYDRTLREVTDLLGRNAELLRESTWVIRKATAAIERAYALIEQLESALPGRARLPKNRTEPRIPLTGQSESYKEEVNGK